MTAIAPFLVSAATALAQLQPIGSFLEMPDGVFYDIVMSSPCGGHYWDPFTIDVAGQQVTVTPVGSAPGTEHGPYYIGCFLFSGSHHDGWRLPRDPAADPGDYTGNAEGSVSAYGDVILNFSEPLTSFGFTSWVGRPCSSTYNPSDTALFYDGPSATGNYLGQVSSSTTATSCYFTLDFVGLVGTTPQIRSVRIPLDEPNGIRIDGIAVSVGVPTPNLTGAVSRKSCDLALDLSGASRTSEPRQGGITEICFSYDDSAPAATVTIEEDTSCPAPPDYATYTGAAVTSCTPAGNDLCCTFTPALENARAFRLIVPSGPGTAQVELRGLVGDVNSDGQVNASDRSTVVGVWTGAGVSCATDLNSDGLTNAADRSMVVGAWTGAANCAP